MGRNLLRLICLSTVAVFVITGWGLFIWYGRETAQVTATNGDLIRLHVLANSDESADQQLKLQVRDAVVAYLTPYLEQVASASEARHIIENHKPTITAIAQAVVAQNGSTYGVQLETGMFDFPVKAYGNVVLPAGKYEAVRILLGQANGKNWWCVLFPPLCFIDGTQATALSATAMPAESKKSETPKIELRWKIAEWWKQKANSD